jgi:hypothetical protein
VVVALGIAAAPNGAAANTEPAPCGTPRAAAATIFSNLKDDRLDLKRAARCVETGKMARDERERALMTLKQAFDAVGARVRLDEISDDGGFLDGRTFEPVVSVARELPRVRLERLDDGQWMIPQSVLQQADRIYDDAVAIDLQKLKKSFPAWTQRKVFGVAAWQLAFLLVFVGVGIALRFVVVRLLLWKSEPLL